MITQENAGFLTGLKSYSNVVSWTLSWLRFSLDLCLSKLSFLSDNFKIGVFIDCATERLERRQDTKNENRRQFIMFRINSHVSSQGNLVGPSQCFQRWLGQLI